MKGDRRYAHEATIRLVERERQLSVDICHDGPSFSVRNGSGIGLQSMRERAAELNDSCVNESRPGIGTTIKVCLPLDVDDA